MANFNKVILVGNLTRDPELRVTPQGLSICKLSLAVNRNYKTAQGEDQEETTYVDVDAFGKPAEIISKYMGKGRPILVEGRLKTDSWTSQAGEKRSKLKVVLENFQFMGGRGDDASDAGRSQYSSGPTRDTDSPAQAGDYESKDIDEDIPF
jgi:single-strand DNA-binding protein